MSQLSGPQVAAAAQAAGFQGDALVTIVAIARRESGWNDNVQGDVAIQTGEWGPSVGLFQIRTLKAETGTGGDRDIAALIPGATPGASGTGTGNPARQAQAAWSISGQGSNFQPWSTFAGISADDMNAAREAVGGVSMAAPLPNAQTTSLLGGGGGDVFDLKGAMDKALGSFLGLGDGGVSGWVVEHAIRTVELVGGAVVFGVALLMFLDVLGHRDELTGEGLIGRTIKHAKRIAEDAAAAMAAAA